ncbi:3'-5' exoribonuclease YhaM family protein [Mesoplasma lactucae]|uniref:CMP-binding protein n=1 Tax=Mesoplasma lactucae ATCC 49193 TaxID=81460 RepID=A0A291IRU2_9MOLU|nr:HD domain-containing protein [Mesoplasma lactucae]ATG97519.1 CMP-binding protein [Mesoplasma lactucae ATCC 49193]ATZ20025.1 3'-5' exoribonuclease [Mesoplasma lactucae ATCC 49193]MCL8217024.1 3'-5' exoribonuclease YhaM [Mesoplasma lactucae ATCC 49193]
MIKPIKNLEANDRDINIIGRIEKVILSTGSNGQNYMIINLVDQSGRVEGRKWQVDENDIENIKPNEIMLVKGGNVNEYRNQLQLKVGDYKILDAEGLAEFNLTFDDFFISAPLNVDKEYPKLIELISAFKNDTYREITLKLLKENEEKFKNYPAAMSIHHNVQHGLFWHSYTLVRNCISIKPNYAFADIDWELVICGAILHDIGKVIEMNDETATDYSLQGKLLGHISIGNAFIYQAAKELGILDNPDGSVNQDVTLLEHMVLASHGKNEYGSPVEPVIIEAIIVSSFDMLDARLFRVNDDLNKVEVGEWTQRIPSEGGKFFYNHYKKPKETKEK